MAVIRTEEQAREYAHCAADFAYFVDTYAVIYDKDLGLGFVPFRLWQGQRWLAWILVTLRMVLILKARQLGISWLIAAYAAWKMQYQRGFTAIIVSKRDEEAVEFVNRIKYILENLPDWLRPVMEGPQHHLRVLGDDGKLFSEAKAQPATEGAGRSLTASLVVLDEFAFAPWARQIWQAAYAVFARPTGGQVFVLSTMKLGTLFAELCAEAMLKQGDGIQSFFFAFLPWWVRPDRDVSWYRAAAVNLKEDVYAEFPATPDEAFKTKTGRLVPEYDESIHFIEPFQIPAEWGWRWLTSRDPGSTAATAWHLAVVDTKGTLYFADELYMPGARISEVVAAESKVRQRWGLEPMHMGMRCDIDLIDPAAAAKKSQEIASDMHLYREEMVKQAVPCLLSPANNEPGIQRLRERFQPYQVPDDSPQGWHWEAKAYVFKNCVNLNDQLKKLVWDEPKYPGENVTTWSGPDHAFDNARYLSNHLPPPGEGSNEKPGELSVEERERRWIERMNEREMAEPKSRRYW